MKIIIDNALESITKTVKPQGNGAMVILPKKWIGKNVQITLLED